MEINFAFLNYSYSESKFLVTYFKKLYPSINFCFYDNFSEVNPSSIRDINILLFKVYDIYGNVEFNQLLKFFRGINKTRYILIYDKNKYYLKEGFKYHIFDYISKDEELLPKINESIQYYIYGIR